MKQFAIKDVLVIEQMKNDLKGSNYRDYLLFLLGINTGIRLSELLSLKFNNIFREDSIENHLLIDNKHYYLHANVKTALIEYKNLQGENYNSEHYLFASQKGHAPIDRSHVYRILSNSATRLNLNLNISTQSLRKTFGYHYYCRGGDINKLRLIFGHPSCKKTMKYIEIEQEKEQFDFKKFFL